MHLIEKISDGISLIEKDNGERKFLCHGIFGQQAVLHYNNEGIINIENDGVLIHKEYDTKEEAIAYWEGINATDGWFAFESVEFEKFKEALV